jgi:SET domain-containing protein
MLLIETYVAPSKIEGLGLFAAAPIMKGAPIWRFDPILDQIIPVEILDRYPPGVRDFIRKYTYVPRGTQGFRVLDCDNGRFMNHSDDPNTDNSGETTVATRDIAMGEEITCSYADFIDGFVPGQFEEVE